MNVITIFSKPSQIKKAKIAARFHSLSAFTALLTLLKNMFIAVDKEKRFPCLQLETSAPIRSTHVRFKE